MQEVIQLLKENPMGYLATVENGEPRVRPWGFMYEEDGKFYFCTANTKEVFAQLKATPYVEFSSSTANNFTWVRLRGAITFSTGLEAKEKIINNMPNIKAIYQSADNPIFEVFYIEHGTALISDFSGSPQKEFTF